ncbi:hypothetical protein [Burkholderia catarinensis]|uniref:hypothetical protein n=1 Tax=Burkholderia catarinensis TaxID=1108140 RepID=UPI0009155E23|nr:hypothetical protein [Burkholderia catarinensis]KAG8154244.1 hypothetical protein BFF94_005525 [Burkholderia catarinensis]
MARRAIPAGRHEQEQRGCRVWFFFLLFVLDLDPDHSDQRLRTLTSVLDAAFDFDGASGA